MTTTFRVCASAAGVLGLISITACQTNGADSSNVDALQADAGCAAASHFQKVSGDARNTGYADPMLRAGCTQSHLAVQSNGIPNFEFVQITPNDLQRQRYSWRIPRQPRAATNKTRIPLLGPVAIAINGLPFYGPNEAPRHGTADPIRDQILDFCSGHTAGRGDYHFHARPDCLFRKVQGMTGLVVGYAFDGYPILAPYECADAACARIKKVRSSYKFIGGARNAWESNKFVEGAGDLDRCNGMTRPNGSYAYYATDGFPYVLACYHGVAEPNRSGGGQGRRQGRRF